MNSEIELLSEVWECVKGFVGKKEKLEAAEALVRCFDEITGLDDVEHNLNELEPVLKAAVVSHFDIHSDDDADDWEE